VWVDVVLMPPSTVGSQLKLPHIAKAMIVQLSTDDLHMLVVPPWFQHTLREWINILLPRSVPLSACRFCDEWVQVSYYGGQVVFGRN
jgi:hypothetical protein